MRTESPNTLSVRSIAAILPRCGVSLGGGAETLVQSLLDQLRIRYPEVTIEIWATCAKDHRTWENFHPPGVTTENGITVRRFPVDERNLEIFIKHELAIAEGWPLTIEEQLEWLGAGVNSRGLYEHIARHGEEFDLLLFAPYLFPTSFWGALIHPDRSVIVPCLHNERYAYLSAFRFLFSSVSGLLFNAAAERQLAEELFAFPDLVDKSGVVGMGFTDLAPEEVDVVGNMQPALPENYILYSGRKERGKNLDKLIQLFGVFKTEYPESDLKLVLIGSGSVDFYDQLPMDVIDLGFVSEAEKRWIMRRAVVLCQPSLNESFSIVLMEAWQEQVAVLVHGDCAVTRDHVVESGGGLYFATNAEFVLAIKRLIDDPDLRKEMGRCGQRYVRERYSWDRVVADFDESIRRIRSESSEPRKRSPIIELTAVVGDS